jgi:hypothetical protein
MRRLELAAELGSRFSIRRENILENGSNSAAPAAFTSETI